MTPGMKRVELDAILAEKPDSIKILPDGSVVSVDKTNQVKPGLEEFLFELTELSRKYHLAINGEPDLFVMEVEDYEIVYFCDDDSRLCIGIEE